MTKLIRTSIRISIAILSILVGLHLVGCGSERRRDSTEVMGTILTVTIEGVPEEVAEGALEAAFEEVRRINDLMSLWRDDSALSRLNREASDGWARTDPEIFDLIKTSKRYSEATGGAFSVTAGPLVRLWGFLRRQERRPPQPEEIEERMAFVGDQLIDLNESRKAVRFAAQGMEIDFGGVAKGYAVDRAVSVLREMGIENALVDLGGNVRSIGAPAGRDSWNIAVRDPRRREGIIGVLEINDQGVASSGQYENYFEHQGRRYGHIIDPRTGWPAEGVLGTTIVAPDAMIADILSTAVFVLGPEEGAKLINGLDGVEGIIIVPRGQDSVLIKVSEGLKLFFKATNATDVQTDSF